MNIQKVQLFIEEEFLVGLSLLIAVSEYGVKGKELWEASGDKKEDEHWPSMLAPHPNFGHFMKCCRFKSCQTFLWLSN